MLLTVFNLPLKFTYNDVKLLMREKCGITDLALDNLMVHGNRRKVTVALSDDSDAAIIFRNINGLHINGDNLYVEELKRRAGPDQPYRSMEQIGSISYVQEPSSNRFNNNYQQPAMLQPNNFVPNSSRLEPPSLQQSRMGMAGSMNYNAGPTGYMMPQVSGSNQPVQSYNNQMTGHRDRSMTYQNLNRGQEPGRRDNRDPYVRNSAHASQRHPEQNNQWLPPRESAYQSFNRGANNDYNSRNAAEYDNNMGDNKRHHNDKSKRRKRKRSKKPYDRNDPARVARRAELGEKLKIFANSLVPPEMQHEDTEAEVPESDQQNLDAEPQADSSDTLAVAVQGLINHVCSRTRQTPLKRRPHAPVYMLMKESIHNRVVEIVAQQAKNGITDMSPRAIRLEYLKHYPVTTFASFLKASKKSAKRIRKGNEPTALACQKLAPVSLSGPTSTAPKDTEEAAGPSTTEVTEV